MHALIQRRIGAERGREGAERLLVCPDLPCSGRYPGLDSCSTYGSRLRPGGSRFGLRSHARPHAQARHQSRARTARAGPSDDLSATWPSHARGLVRRHAAEPSGKGRQRVQNRYFPSTSQRKVLSFQAVHEGNTDWISERGPRRLSHKSSQHESQSAGTMVSTGPAARIPAEAPEHADAPSGTRGSKS